MSITSDVDPNFSVEKNMHFLPKQFKEKLLRKQSLESFISSMNQRQNGITEEPRVIFRSC